MINKLTPVDYESPRQQIARQIEKLIISGQIKPGNKLPTQRELADRMGVNKTMIQAALTDLAGKGLVSIRQGHGCTVNDFRREGSIELLNALYDYEEGSLDPGIHHGLESLRRLILGDSIRNLVPGLSNTGNSASETLSRLEDIRLREKKQPDNCVMAKLDFEFYREIIIGGGNIVYLLMFNSTEKIYCNILEKFFSKNETVKKVSELKDELMENIRTAQPESAAACIEKLLAYSTYNMEI